MPTITVSMTIRVEPELYAMISERAAADGVSLNETVKTALREYCAFHGKTPKNKSHPTT